MSWNFTSNSFTSGVFKDGKFQVRARDKESLINLFGDESRIVTNAGTDYPFRVFSTQEEYAELIKQSILAIDYRNFKDEVKKQRGAEFAHALMGVWTAMLKVEPVGVRRFIGTGSWRLPNETGNQSTYRRNNKKGKKGKGAKSSYNWAQEHWDRDADYLDRDLPELTAEVEDLLTDEQRAELDKLPDSMHDWTEDQWQQFMSENPGGI